MSQPPRAEIYISVDIEADGPLPGPNSMLSLGAVAFAADRRQLGTFTINFVELSGATPDPETMAWWRKQPPETWSAARTDPQPPLVAMTNFVQWIKTVSAGALPVFVGYPAGYDFLFVYWYLIKFVGESPFSFSALDIKTYAAAVLGCDFRAVTKQRLKTFCEPNLPHTHVAVDDALEQGYLFLNLKAACERNRTVPTRHTTDEGVTVEAIDTEET